MIIAPFCFPLWCEFGRLRDSEQQILVCEFWDWVASRTMDQGLPLLSLAFAGLNFTVIRYGDSIRAYGLATVFILLTMSLIWRFIEAPTMRRGLLAGMAAVLSVQTLYQNAFFC